MMEEHIIGIDMLPSKKPNSSIWDFDFHGMRERESGLGERGLRKKRFTEEGECVLDFNFFEYEFINKNFSGTEEIYSNYG